MAGEGQSAAAAVRHRRATTPGAGAEAGEHRNRLATAFDALERLPAAAAPRDRLLRSLREANPVQNEVVAAIESDPALTIAFLGMANRSRKARRQVTDVREAVAALPAPGVAFLATRVPAVGLFERAGTWGASAQEFRIHAVAAQAVADRLATKIGYPCHGRLRASVLLHDIGKLVLGHAYAEYAALAARPDRTPEARLAEERREFGIDHAAVGAVAARRLGLPQAVARAIQEHHGLSANPEAQIVRLADALAHYWSGDAVEPAQLTDLAASLGLSSEFLDSLLCDLPYARAADASFAEPSPLSRREREVLRLLSDGKQYKVIAAELGLATSTVRTHLHNLYSKIGVADRAQAVLTASKRGWL
jgi:putative nucleotidyltransferase with HDIG domain